MAMCCLQLFFNILQLLFYFLFEYFYSILSLLYYLFINYFILSLLQYLTIFFSNFHRVTLSFIFCSIVASLHQTGEILELIRGWDQVWWERWPSRHVRPGQLAPGTQWTHGVREHRQIWWNGWKTRTPDSGGEHRVERKPNCSKDWVQSWFTFSY